MLKSSRRTFVFILTMETPVCTALKPTFTSIDDLKGILSVWYLFLFLWHKCLVWQASFGLEGGIRLQQRWFVTSGLVFF